MNRITFAACTDHLEAANQLFYELFGEREADLNTFVNPTYTDGTKDYAVASCPITAEQEAMVPAELNGCMYRIGDEPLEALADMGLTRIEHEAIL